MCTSSSSYLRLVSRKQKREDTCEVITQVNKNSKIYEVKDNEEGELIKEERESIG